LSAYWVLGEDPALDGPARIQYYADAWATPAPPDFPVARPVRRSAARPRY